jgi:PTH1 family peptidyl-tRNA hydrolase
VPFLLDRSADMVESLIQRGVEWTQNAYHGV